MKKMLFTLMLILPALCAEAKIITVDDDGVGADFTRIQDAIDDTGTKDGDTIKVKAGTYSENIAFNNKAVRVTSWDPDDQSVVEETIITATSDYSVRFDFGETSGAIITGFTITGRGIYCNAASPTISKNIITGCTNNGITGENYSTPLILSNTITSNGPAGIWECHGHVSGNVITHNGDAGAIHFCKGDIIGNEISNNVNTGDGGALHQCTGRIVGNVIKDNFAALTGGAIYVGGGTIAENLISGNTALGPGGAFSVVGGYVHHNIIAGNRGSSGGGAYNCTANFYNNTVVGNRADEGGAFWRCVGIIQDNIIAFNKAGDTGGILGMSNNAYNCFWQNTAGHFGQGAFAGTGDFIADPLFVQPGQWDPNGTPANPLDDFWIDGEYHLLAKNGRWDTNFDIWVTDSTTSPCIDAGNPDADWTAEYWRHGGLINLGRYGGTAQASMSLSDVGNVADLNLDGLVDFRDVAIFSTIWPWRVPLLREDLDRDGDVDSADYAILVANWQPLPLPTPNPMTWAVEPNVDSPTSITMTASDANSSDETGVEYYFQETSGNPGGDDSPWQTQTTYTDVGLTAGKVYSYRVKARNKGNHLETEFSLIRSATTLSPPNPDPMTWATPPAATADDIITMTAATAVSTDGSGVEYRHRTLRPDHLPLPGQGTKQRQPDRDPILRAGKRNNRPGPGAKPRNMDNRTRRHLGNLNYNVSPLNTRRRQHNRVPVPERRRPDGNLAVKPDLYGKRPDQTHSILLQGQGTQLR